MSSIIGICNFTPRDLPGAHQKSDANAGLCSSQVLRQLQDIFVLPVYFALSVRQEIPCALGVHGVLTPQSGIGYEKSKDEVCRRPRLTSLDPSMAKTSA